MKFLFGLGMVIATVGVILIYDARPITKKMFSFGDQNDGALGLKVTGFLIIVIFNYFLKKLAKYKVIMYNILVLL